MKYLNKNIIKEIESHFYNWSYEKEELCQLSRHFAYGTNTHTSEDSSIKACAHAPKEQRAAEMKRHIQYLQGWVKLVDTVRGRLANTPQLSFITMLYVERLSEVQICEKLFIERRTFYNWKSEFLGYAAMKACEMGLISV